MTNSFRSLQQLAAAIPDGARIAVAQDSCGVSMALTRALIRRKARGLHLVCVPISGMQADLLIGAGCVDTIETSAVSLGEYGSAPRFLAALRSGRLRLLEATCPAIHAALQAGEKDLPFIPLRGLIGSDIVRVRPDWKVIENPFADAARMAQGGDPIVLLPAIRPDVAIFHAPFADREGNVFIGRKRELLTMAHAAFRSLVTVERIIEGSVFDNPATAAGSVPAIYVDGIAVLAQGAAPVGLPEHYVPDGDQIKRYASAALSDEGFAGFVRDWLQVNAAADDNTVAEGRGASIALKSGGHTVSAHTIAAPSKGAAT
jgi:glutaconate CoA-transferase subunit A